MFQTIICGYILVYIYVLVVYNIFCVLTKKLFWCRCRARIAQVEHKHHGSTIPLCHPRVGRIRLVFKPGFVKTSGLSWCPWVPFSCWRCHYCQVNKISDVGFCLQWSNAPVGVPAPNQMYPGGHGGDPRPPQLQSGVRPPPPLTPCPFRSPLSPMSVSNTATSSVPSPPDFVRHTDKKSKVTLEEGEVEVL